MGFAVETKVGCKKLYAGLETTIHRQIVSLESDDSIRRAMRRCGVKSYEWFMSCVSVFAVKHKIGEVNAVEVYPLEAPKVAAAPEAPHADVEVWVRGIREARDAGTTFQSIEGALLMERPPEDAVIEWAGTEHLAALDCDFHDIPFDSRPTVFALDAALPRIRPRPDFAWLTHGRGIRCIYRGFGRWNADELAAVAFLSVRDAFPEAECEIKKITRHPRVERNGTTCGPIRRGEGLPDLRPITERLTATEAPETAVAEWLASRGFEIGKRYPHDRCVIAPSDSGGRDPVVIRENGVHCHYCEGRTGRGFRSFRSLAGTVSASLLGAMVRGRVHWGHARHVFERQLELTGRPAELCYRAALKCIDGVDEESVASIFDRRHHYLRFGGFWATGDGETMGGDIGPILAELPACSGSAARVAEFKQPISLERHGYYPIRPIWGCRIAGVHPFALPPDRWTTDAVFYPPDLRSEYRVNYRPRYLRENARDLDGAWRALENVFPGINRNYLRLLIAAKGCVEAGGGRQPMIFASGCTAAAKTATVKLAASICGDRVSVIEYHPNPERRGQSLLAAKERCSFLLCDEVNKSGADAGKSAVQTMQYILNIDPNASAHKLYVGQVEIGTLPVFVWTDTSLPDDVRSHAQIARRLTWVELTDRVEWEPTLLGSGVGKPEAFRLSSEEHARACDAILSDVIDTYFREPPNFDRIAADLGFRRVEEHDTGNAVEMVRAFFREVCKAPEASHAAAGGPGWVEIRDNESELSTAWDLVKDEGLVFGSRLVAERDLRKALGLSQPTRFEAVTRGTRRFIRFVGLSDGRTNRDLVGLEPGARLPDRPGNSVGGGFDPSGFTCLPSSSFDAVALPRGSD